MSQKIYEMITERIVEMLERGTVPWSMPWTGGPSGSAPANLDSKRAYNGINHFLLLAMGRSSSYWVTYNQAKKMGGQVRKGEKGTPVIFWKQIEVEEEENGKKIKKKIPMLRYYTVFNLEQIDGIEAPDAPEPVKNDFRPIEKAERIFNSMPQAPEIAHNEPRAYYSPKRDTINLPKPELFRSNEEYYSAAFHEMVHSTGHESRLNRRPSTEIRSFGDREYSKEELVAEMGAAYLCAHAGIENATINNSAAYIDGWINVLKGSPKMAIHAAGAAQKAANFILGND